MNPYSSTGDYFSPLQAFVFYNNYSRYVSGRRESWPESVSRLMETYRALVDGRLPDALLRELEQAILTTKISPSMRLLAMAGPAFERSHITAYNCCFTGIDTLESFGEVLYILMAGTGVGFSVEKKYLDRLPNLPNQLVNGTTTFTIPDSSEGWQAAVNFCVLSLFNGTVPSFNYSQLRPAGAPLKTKGGTASGPDHLRTLLNFIIATITSHYDFALDNLTLRGPNRLSSLEIHDILCQIGTCVVSGGVRRSAMIALFDQGDTEMRNAKAGKFPEIRYVANNSEVWYDNPSRTEYDEFMDFLFEHRTGENGICHLGAMRKSGPSRRNTNLIAGFNPCGEIKLRHKQFCNLSSVLVSASDTVTSLLEKVKWATLAGTIQAMATYFPGIDTRYADNCVDERLLGVDLNGIASSKILMNDAGAMRRTLRDYAVHLNKEFAAQLGIKPATAVTCIKPNGNSSQLYGTSSGMHPWYAPYYVRGVQVNKLSPVYYVLADAGVPMFDFNQDTAVAEFPVAAPEGAQTKDDYTAIGMCEEWLKNKRHYTEHNPSVTVYYRDEEQKDLREWVWKHLDDLGGMTFFPADDKQTAYSYTPYRQIDEATYKDLRSRFPVVDWGRLALYDYDNTTATGERACFAGQCEI